MALEALKRCNNLWLNQTLMKQCLPLYVGNIKVGLVEKHVSEILSKYPHVFEVQVNKVKLNDSLTDYEGRSAALEQVMGDLRRKQTFLTLEGWRNECYDVWGYTNEKPVFKVERAAAPLLGVPKLGIHVNGFIENEEGMSLWLQKRSDTKPTWPGLLDNLVGGGLASNYSILRTAFKESQEEASVPDHILENLKPVGTVSLLHKSERGIHPNTEHVFDLKLPEDFVPVNADGEVESFELLPIEEVVEKVASSAFKTTSCPVTLDFLVRHGIINIRNEPHLADLVELLHIPHHMIFSKIEDCFI